MIPCDTGKCIIGLSTQYHETGIVREIDLDLSKDNYTIVNQTACLRHRNPDQGEFTLFNFCPMCGKTLDAVAIQTVINASHNPDTCDHCSWKRDREAEMKDISY